MKFQDFQKALRLINDKKAHGLDGMPVLALKRIGETKAFYNFSQWINLRLSKEDNTLVSTAKVVFLSKVKKEIVTSHSEYRILAV